MCIDNLVVQYTPHEDNNNKNEDDETSKVADKDIPEYDVHHPQITLTTERLIYNLIPRNPRKHHGVNNKKGTQEV